MLTFQETSHAETNIFVVVIAIVVVVVAVVVVVVVIVVTVIGVVPVVVVVVVAIVIVEAAIVVQVVIPIRKKCINRLNPFWHFFTPTLIWLREKILLLEILIFSPSLSLSLSLSLSISQSLLSHLRLGTYLCYAHY